MTNPTLEDIRNPFASQMREYYDSVVLRVGRAMIRAEQDQWETPAEEWDIETMKMHGIYEVALAAFGEATQILEEERQADYRGGHC